MGELNGGKGEWVEEGRSNRQVRLKVVGGWGNELAVMKSKNSLTAD